MEPKRKDAGQEQQLFKKYNRGIPSPDEKFIETITNFIVSAEKLKKPKEQILTEALQLIQSLSQFKECAFGLRDPDGAYRFKRLVGFGQDAETARKEIVYSEADMRDIITYRPIIICRFSQFHLSEMKPYKPGMEITFNKPNLLNSERKHPDDMTEGDYIEIPLQGKDREIIGWIELSGPASGKLPKREVILQIEFFASCLIPMIKLVS